MEKALRDSLLSPEYKQEVGQWSRLRAQHMINNVKSMTGKPAHGMLAAFKFAKIKTDKVYESKKLGERHLEYSIKSYVNSRDGIPERISFPFIKHGFFIAVGSSRGHSAKKNPRNIIDWYNREFQQAQIDKLADIVTKYHADAAVNATDIGNKNLKVY